MWSWQFPPLQFLHDNINRAGLLNRFELCRVVLPADLVRDDVVKPVSLALPLALPQRIKNTVDMLAGVLELQRRDNAKRPSPLSGLVMAPDRVAADVALPERKTKKIGAVRVYLPAVGKARLNLFLTPAAIDQHGVTQT